MSAVIGERVVERYRFGKPGTIVAEFGSWAWIMWDEYPPEHEPTTHHRDGLKPVDDGHE